MPSYPTPLHSGHTCFICLQAVEANAIAPADQQLSEAELVLNMQLLAELRGGVAVEEAQLLSEAPRQSQEQELQAKRLKALCWDAFQVGRSQPNCQLACGQVPSGL